VSPGLMPESFLSDLLHPDIARVIRIIPAIELFILVF